MKTPEQIAASLSDAVRSDLEVCDPQHIVAPISSLLCLALAGLADIRTDNTVFLNATGLSVRAILKDQDDVHS